MKKTFVIVALAGLIVLVFAIILLDGNTGSKIPDVKKPWKRDFSDSVNSLLHGSLAIQVEGFLDGKAILHTCEGDIELSSGQIKKLMVSQEAWTSKCRTSKCSVEYQPIDVQSGTLTVQVAIGRLPSWAQRPILDTEPVNYVGGWTTWYPDRMRMYSKGFYFCGQKNGHWWYWNKDSSILREEEWDYGRLITNSTKNAVHRVQ